MYCPNCGSEIKDTAKFCPHCGFQIEAMKAPEVPEAPAEQVPAEDTSAAVMPEEKQKTIEELVESFHDENGKNGNRGKTGLIIGLVVVLAIAAIGAGLFFFKKKGPDYSGYVESVMDLAFKGEKKKYVEFTGKTEDQITNPGNDTPEALGMESDDVSSNASLAFQKAYDEYLTHAKYTVGEAIETEDGVDVVVTFQRMSDPFEGYEEAVMDHLKDKIVSEELDKNNWDDYKLGLQTEAMLNNMDRITYSDEVSVTAHLAEYNEEDGYQITNLQEFLEEAANSAFVFDEEKDSAFESNINTYFASVSYVYTWMEYLINSDYEKGTNTGIGDEKPTYDVAKVIHDQLLCESEAMKRDGIKEETIEYFRETKRMIWAKHKYEIKEPVRTTGGYTVDVAITPLEYNVEEYSAEMATKAAIAYAKGEVTMSQVSDYGCKLYSETLREHINDLPFGITETVSFQTWEYEGYIEGDPEALAKVVEILDHVFQ